jgi:hypothetical protein
MNCLKINRKGFRAGLGRPAEIWKSNFCELKKNEHFVEWNICS